MGLESTPGATPGSSNRPRGAPGKELSGIPPLGPSPVVSLVGLLFFSLHCVRARGRDSDLDRHGAEVRRRPHEKDLCCSPARPTHCQYHRAVKNFGEAIQEHKRASPHRHTCRSQTPERRIGRSLLGAISLKKRSAAHSTPVARSSPVNVADLKRWDLVINPVPHRAR